MLQSVWWTGQDNSPQCHFLSDTGKTAVTWILLQSTIIISEQSVSAYFIWNVINRPHTGLGSPPTFKTPAQTAPGGSTFAVHGVILTQPKINTGCTKLPAINYCINDTLSLPTLQLVNKANSLLILWHYSVSFMAVLGTTGCRDRTWLLYNSQYVQCGNKEIPCRIKAVSWDSQYLRLTNIILCVSRNFLSAINYLHLCKW